MFVVLVGVVDVVCVDSGILVVVGFVGFVGAGWVEGLVFWFMRVGTESRPIAFA